MLGGSGVRRVGRRPAFCVFAAALAGVGGTACQGPQPKVSACTPSLITSIETINSKLTADGTLRHARTLKLPDDSGYFISAELLPANEDPNFDGKISTWFTEDPESGQFTAVDVNARASSAWPDSEFDVRRDGAITSRGCVLPVRGTPADGECPPGLENFC